MRIGIMQPYFFPYLGYFQLINAVDLYVNLDHVSFMKRSYMTRNKIKDGIPIRIDVLGGSQNKKCTEVSADICEKYIKKFKKTLFHTYGKERLYSVIMSEIIDETFIERPISISDFNLEIIKRICQYLEINTKIIDSSEGITGKKREEGLKDIVKKYGADFYINAIGGTSLYNKEYFKNFGIELNFIEMADVNVDDKYSSILDLLFRYDKEHLKKELNNYRLL